MAHEYTQTWRITEPDTQITISQSGEYLVTLDKPGASVNLVGVFSAHGSEKIAVSVLIHHRSPHTRAETTLKAVGADHAQVRFVGKIIIDEKCPDSQSFLTERVLLLDPTARAEAIPELEILTDDVRCSHAASVSTVSKEHLFYLQSRGIPSGQARSMIVEGFLGGQTQKPEITATE